MIEVMPESQGNVIGVRIGGKITAREYENVIIPRVEAIFQKQPPPDSGLQEGKLGPARFSPRHIYFIKRFVTR